MPDWSAAEAAVRKVFGENHPMRRCVEPDLESGEEVAFLQIEGDIGDGEQWEKLIDVYELLDRPGHLNVVMVSRLSEATGRDA